MRIVLRFGDENHFGQSVRQKKNSLKAVNVTQIPAVVEFKRKLLKRYPDQIDRVMLFGSVARKDNNPDSDIDLLVFLKVPFSSCLEWEIMDLAYEINLEYDVILDVKVISIHDMDHPLIGGSPLIYNVMQEGIAV